MYAFPSAFKIVTRAGVNKLELKPSKRSVCKKEDKVNIKRDLSFKRMNNKIF